MSISSARGSKVTQFLKKLRGGSQPILVQADDGLLYVAKFADNLQGTNLPFNESMGAELYRACGLTVPAWKPLLLTDHFLDRNPGCWIETEHGRRRPSGGLCFGSQYLGAGRVRLTTPATAFHRICNREDFWLSWLVDVCADHMDNRQALFVEGSNGQLLACFIDQGHFFGGPGHASARPAFAASRYLDLRIYPQLSSRRSSAMLEELHGVDGQRIWRRLTAVPEIWKTPKALDKLSQCLNRLADWALLKSLLETLADSIGRRSEGECVAGRLGCQPWTVVLRSRRAVAAGGAVIPLRRPRPVAGDQKTTRSAAVPGASGRAV